MFTKIKDKTIRIGIVGFGHIGKRHFEIMRDFEDVELVGIADPIAADAGQAYDVPVYRNLTELLDNATPHVVVLCTPSALHCEQACEAASRGVHVITEKPLATTREDAKKMMKGCSDASVLLTVIYQYRYLDTAQRLKQYISDGSLGEVIFANAEVLWRRDPEYFQKDGGWRAADTAGGGGALINQGVHAVDLLCWLVGSLESVSASMSTRTADIQAEDTVGALMQFTNGALGIVQVTTAASNNGDMKVTIQGTCGSATLQGRKLSIEYQGSEGDRIRVEDAVPNEVDLKTELHRIQLQSTLAALRSGDTDSVDVVDGRRSMDATLAMYEAAAQGRFVALESVEEMRQML